MSPPLFNWLNYSFHILKRHFIMTHNYPVENTNYCPSLFIVKVGDEQEPISVYMNNDFVLHKGCNKTKIDQALEDFTNFVLYSYTRIIINGEYSYLYNEKMHLQLNTGDILIFTLKNSIPIYILGPKGDFEEELMCRFDKVSQEENKLFIKILNDFTTTLRPFI